MKVLTKNQKSNLNNDDIKWYLSDEKLWISKCREYAEIESGIGNLTGSFNWLYEINDTVLFRKDTAAFETAVIDLAGKINIHSLNDSSVPLKNIKKGNLFIADRNNCNFEFPSSVAYRKTYDSLIAFPTDYRGNEDMVVLLIADDFGFIIVNDRLRGWILNRASSHIYAPRPCGDASDEAPDLLDGYFRALHLWEENEEDTTALGKLLELVKEKEDRVSFAIKESIMNIL